MFLEQLPWINLSLGKSGTLSMQYLLGIDGMNLGCLGLAWVIIGIATVASCRITQAVKAYALLLLSLNAIIMGCLATLDLLLFCFLFELALLPLYGFIAFWGESRYPQAATIFFLYTFLGALCMLVVTIAIGLSAYDPIATGIQAGLWEAATAPLPTAEVYALVQTGIREQQIPLECIVHTFDMTLLRHPQCFLPGSLLETGTAHLLLGHPARLLAFLVFVCGLLIKLAAFPFHSWLPVAHVAAPTPISIMLAGIVLKLGGYALFRIYSILPEAAMHYGWWIGGIGVTSMLYAGCNALAVRDFKQLVAYSSMAHMGFFLVGMSSRTVDGMQGALYQMLSHGLIVSLLFLLVDMLASRTQDRSISHYGGLVSVVPRYTVFTALAFAAAMGIPGFSGFMAEVLILLGVFRAATLELLPLWMGILCSLGMLLNAAYYVQVIYRMFLGKLALPPAYMATTGKLPDLHKHEVAFLALLLLLVIYLGICPSFVLRTSQGAIGHLVEVMRAHVSA
jgi:NADH-quinone oxidoreductase subunit M